MTRRHAALLGGLVEARTEERWNRTDFAETRTEERWRRTELAEMRTEERQRRT